MGVCYVILVLLCIIVLLYICLELHYFLRVTLCVLLARFCKRKTHILQETTIHGICVTTDIDTLLYHMNNARFMRELDFARVDFYERTGLYRCIRNKGGSVAMGATTIRYRRFIRLFHRYMVTSKIIYWDEQNIFMEHRFVTPRDKFINAIVITRTRLINCSAEEVMNELQVIDADLETSKKMKPELPEDVQKWIEYNTMSSDRLRSECL